MKKYLILAIAIGFVVTDVSAGVDPATAAAVGAQTLVLSESYSKREKLQDKIKTTEATITLAMENVHQVENKMLGYLSNATAAVQNLYQLRRAGELLISIGNETYEVGQAVKERPIPGIISTAISKDLIQVYADAASLVPFVQQLCSSGTIGSGDDRHKVNLLNSAERYYIASTVVAKLEDMARRLRFLKYRIEFFQYRSLLWQLDPESARVLFSTEMCGKRAKTSWDRLTKKIK